MSDKLFQEAKLVEDLIQSYPNIFSSKPKELLNKLEQLKRGLPIENEFIALCLWMNRCNIIHKLDQDQLPKNSKNIYQVPDIFASFTYKDKQIPVLIEIKTTTGKTKIKFSEKYYRRLINYSQLTKLPLLIGWKIKEWGLWVLVDINIFKKQHSAYHLDYEEAFRNNLFSLLLGDYSIHFYPGIQFTYTIIKGQTLSDNEFIGKITDIYFINNKGEKIKQVSLLFLFTIFFIQFQEETIENNDFVKFIVKLPEETGQFMFASQLLGIAISGFKEMKTQILWHELIQENKFKISYDNFYKANHVALKNGLIHLIGRIKPNICPSFINM